MNIDLTNSCESIDAGNMEFIACWSYFYQKFVYLLKMLDVIGYITNSCDNIDFFVQ